MISHLLRVAHSQLREAAKRGSKIGQLLTNEPARSPRWPKVERAFKTLHPLCAACGGDERLNVHHKKPFHLDPALELDNRNLITLCMGKLECHLRIGHGDNFKAYNPDVEADAAKVAQLMTAATDAGLQILWDQVRKKRQFQLEAG